MSFQAFGIAFNVSHDSSLLKSISEHAGRSEVHRGVTTEAPTFFTGRNRACLLDPSTFDEQGQHQPMAQIR
jgi:hypothetical protein